MPPLYEQAAHLLLFLTRAGLVISPGDYHAVLMRLSELLLEALSRRGPFSHYQAAADILGDLEARKLVTRATSARRKILAVLGTGIGNLAPQGQK
ncbi:hypothetical protein [Hyphomicrobium sp.]|uniref:hypothetical protein n=1 Tax=Hyphomicrobium sp. TaxID=82 RepID=UPI002FE11C13